MKSEPPAVNKRSRGRPAIYATDADRKAAQAEASRRYRDRQRAAKQARQVAARSAANLERLQATTCIDLSPISYSKREPQP